MTVSSSLYQQALESLKIKSQLRTIPSLVHDGQFVAVTQAANSTNKPSKLSRLSKLSKKTNDSPQQLINIASNDYLAIGANNQLQAEFIEFIYQLPTDERPRMGSTSSRLLTGNDVQLEQLEMELEAWYNINNSNNRELEQKSSKSALIFNSGYHTNLGILPALTALPANLSNSSKTLILADKLVHASIIDGILLANTKNKCPFKRYRHNDHEHLRQLISQSDDSIDRIIIVTESVFSMDGDIADLVDLVTIKATDTRIELYVDEAHAVGVFGETGLGLAEATDTLADIDYLVGTFGKAFASMGAYLICHADVKSWLINSMRPLIYSTALPPMTHAWSRFILQKMPTLDSERQYLAKLSNDVRLAIEQKIGLPNPSESPIIPYILGDNELAVAKAKNMQHAGFYALAIRPPTVPANTARIRLVMNAGLDLDTCERLIASL